ncbi:hypothetical protein [Sediminispirochaeta bajacaliforniensis]|uniref:hypothetical protein n=1 Tax=Sediminispirochaeta bajacaliforniensis TaxID=148 RepID=UPI000363FBD0|nr:hypothetical protein [Sediminispirochaeta bajacaliforniensis]
MNRRLWTLLYIVALALLLAGCEQMFTYSPLSWAARDPSKLSDDQQVAYAQMALSSGDAETLQKAYDAIADNSDPDVQLLASQVALGASGLNEAVENIVDELDAGIDEADIDAGDILGSLDQTYLQAAGTSLAAAEAGGADISDTDYLLAAASLVLSEAITGGGTQSDLEDVIDTIDTLPSTPSSYSASQSDAENAAYFLSQASMDIDDIDSLLDMLNP